MLDINPDADPKVCVPFTSGFFVTVDALQTVEHNLLAYFVFLTLEKFEEEVRAWAKSDGLSYGILAPLRGENDASTDGS
jgi:hypothetical protein